MIRLLNDWSGLLCHPSGAGRGGFGPGVVELLAVILDVGLTVGGQGRGVAALDALDGDQSLVLELLQDRVDRTRTWCPDARAALGDVLDELVAVARGVGKEQQYGSPYVSAASAAPPTAATIRSAETGTESHSAELAVEAWPELSGAARGPGRRAALVVVEVSHQRTPFVVIVSATIADS